MKKLFCFRPWYFLFTVILFVTEILIALYISDNFIRPYGGDYLVVILIYCFIRTFFRIPVAIAAIGTLLFSFLVEFLQYVNIVEILGLGNSRLAKTVIGTSFSWTDIFAYILGVLTTILIEFLFAVRRQEYRISNKE